MPWVIVNNTKYWVNDNVLYDTSFCGYIGASRIIPCVIPTVTGVTNFTYTTDCICGRLGKNEPNV